ncbi:MAG: spermidine/putrescine ABC transporter ATP-binding protein [Epsilonproteobacteria bacterium]|nr:spermidine/putrescine ABC transporter ATP-binding protein [Campylobacterota bacterium]|tara:strand:+ start:1099 stop:2190 length:1092 start_codon:yes stop_codon:yes gene_type:complete
MKGIVLQGINKSYDGSDTVLQDLNLKIPGGKFFALLGPSGCGKTTILRMIAGLEKPDTGSIFLGDQDITHVPVNKRSVNTVFQNYALFPHMNVFENIAYSLRLKELSEELIIQKVDKVVRMFHLESLIYKRVTQLSGGQQQRVAIARAVINEPDVLLFDEPLAALDLRLREKVLLELIELQDHLETTFVYITHDQTEALTVADQMAIMNQNGNIEQVGHPQEIYEHPKSVFVANFVGTTNIIQGFVVQRDNKWHLEVDKMICLSIKIEEGQTLQDGDEACIGIRPEKIEISKKILEGFANCLTGVVQAIVYQGRFTQYNVRLQNGYVLQVFEQNERHFQGDEIDYDDHVYVYWQRENAMLLKK